MRERSREMITRSLALFSHKYVFGKPLRLPFGMVYPASSTGGSYFDLQIEGIGTKTLLAELSGKYDTIGIDAVAMVVNDVLRSGATPLLLSDGIHISENDKFKVSELLSGVRRGAKLSKCVLASGETGNVGEILHKRLGRKSPPFDLMVSCLGLVRRTRIIKGDIAPGDEIIGLRSSGIHSNGLTLARKVLLQQWGGKYDPWRKLDSIGRPILDELLEPTKIYADAVEEVANSTQLKAAIHITGDGFAKFNRLLAWTRRLKRHGKKLGLRFEGLRRMPSIFKLIYETSKESGSPISPREMFRTFNMGYGFAVVTEARNTNQALDYLYRHCNADKIGLVCLDGNVSVLSTDFGNRLIL